MHQCKIEHQRKRIRQNLEQQYVRKESTGRLRILQVIYEQEEILMKKDEELY